MLAVEGNQAQESQGTYRVAQNFCGSLFLRIGDWRLAIGDWRLAMRELIWQIGFSCWELIFAIFRKYAVPRVDNIFVFIK